MFIFCHPFLRQYVVLLSGRESLQVFVSFVYKCIVADDPDIKRGFGIPLNGLTPPVIINLQGGGGASNYFE